MENVNYKFWWVSSSQNSCLIFTLNFVNFLARVLMCQWSWIELLPCELTCSIVIEFVAPQDSREWDCRLNREKCTEILWWTFHDFRHTKNVREYGEKSIILLSRPIWSWHRESHLKVWRSFDWTIILSLWLVKFHSHPSSSWYTCEKKKKTNYSLSSPELYKKSWLLTRKRC